MFYYTLSMKYYVDLTVRPYECDSYSHVNNAVYLNYLEFARMEYLHQIGFDYKGAVAAGYYLYVTHVDIHYKASAFLDDKLKIEVFATAGGSFGNDSSGCAQRRWYGLCCCGCNLVQRKK